MNGAFALPVKNRTHFSCYVSCNSLFVFVSEFYGAYFVSQKKKCSVSVVTTKLVSTAIGSRMEYSSKVRGKEKSVYDKVAREFRELEKNADKYFDNLDAVEEMCYQAKKEKNAETFRLKAEAVKEIFKKDAAVRVKLYSTIIEM